MSASSIVGPHHRNSSAPIALRVLRRTWKGALGLGVVFAVVVAASSKTFVSTFPTEASRRSMATAFNGQGGFSMLFGSVARIGSVGGYTAYKTYAFLTTIAAVWAVMTTTRNLRGEEDAGRWQLVLADHTSPARATAATIVGLSASSLIVFACTALGTAAVGASPSIGFGFGSSIVFAAATVLPALVFIGVAAVASQLARSRHLSSTIAMGVFAVAFVVRMLSDSGPRSHALAWVTPLGWPELVRPLTVDDPWPLLAGLGAFFVLAAVAVMFANRRDTGAAMFGTNETRRARLAGLGSTVGLAARLSISVTLAWAVGLLATAFVYGLITHAVIDALAGSESTTSLLARMGGTGTTTLAFVTIAFVLQGTVLALVPAHHIALARDEERSGRVGLAFAFGIGRRRWLGERIGLAALVIVVLGPLSGALCWAGAVGFGAHLAWWPMIGAGISIVPPALVALAVGSLVLAIAPRAAPVSVEVVVAWSLIIDLVGSLVDGLRPLSTLSLFHYTGGSPAAPPDWIALAASSFVALGLMAVAVAVFERRDVAFG